jgi:putative ABC transport system ATP-binding protein
MTAQSRELAVRCDGVTKSFGEGTTRVHALRGIRLEIRRGELLMLVGPSGCGKTTLISVIAGVLDRDGGACDVFGTDVQHMRQKARAVHRSLHVGFVFQSFNLLPTLTAAENAAVPLLIQGRPRREALGRARNALARFGFDGRMMEALPRQLSGGEQQRVAIARAIVHNPRLIVCDEPTSALDHDTGQRVMGLLRGVALQEDRTLVVVTHDARIFGFADRIARMDDGLIVDVGEQHKAS